MRRNLKVPHLVSFDRDQMKRITQYNTYLTIEYVPYLATSNYHDS